MKPIILKVIADGRITLPKEIREENEIGAGDFVEIKFVRKVNGAGVK